MSKAIRYIARVRGAREVALVGKADLAYWRRFLEPEALTPLDADGHARLVIMAVSARWMGVRFRESSVCVFLEPPETEDDVAVFMTQAFNSSRVLTFFERNSFRTPYRHADVSVNVDSPVVLGVTYHGTPIFGARMSDDPASPTTENDTEDGWKGAIFIPRRAGRRPEAFFGGVAGPTRTIPFADADHFELRHHSEIPVIRRLEDSGFQPTTWHVRADSRHARSKTVSRERASSLHAARV